MKIDSSLFGFSATFFFKLKGRRYTNGRGGIRTLNNLTAMYIACRSSTDHSWAIRARPLIHEVQSLNARPTLCLVVRRTRDPLMRLLAIWMLGRCRGTFGTAAVAHWATDLDFHTRKEVVRALKRKAGWATLAMVAENEPEPRIRRLASCQPPKQIEGRISRFMSHVSDESVNESGMPLFVSPLLDIGRGKMPRTAYAIRLVLERIRRLVGDPV